MSDKSGYYCWKGRGLSRTARYHQWLTREIKRVFEEHKGRYGFPWIALQLYDEGIETNKRQVAMLMQRADLTSLYSHKRHKRQKHGAKEGVLRDNLLRRDFHSMELGAIFVTDITYIFCAD